MATKAKLHAYMDNFDARYSHFKVVHPIPVFKIKQKRANNGKDECV